MAWGATKGYTEPTASERLSRITAAVKKLSDEVLARIVITRPEHWVEGKFVNAAGARCLVGHLEDWKYAENGIHFPQKPLNENLERVQLMADFDGLVSHYGNVKDAAKSIRKIILEEQARRSKKKE
jgi:hypothetical protein